MENFKIDLPKNVGRYPYILLKEDQTYTDYRKVY